MMKKFLNKKNLFIVSIHQSDKRLLENNSSEDKNHSTKKPVYNYILVANANSRVLYFILFFESL